MNKWPIKILHLGLGRFHRAHQAAYYQKLFNQYDIPWGVAAFSMRTPDARDRLRAVNNRYPVIEISREHKEITWIESVRETYFAFEDHVKLENFFCSEEIELITLTMTEKAYSLDAVSQNNSAISIIFAGLKSRKERLDKPITVISCDNLRENGRKLRQVLLDYASLIGDEETKSWIEQQVAFPNCMVDRIVPALTSDKIQSLQKQFNLSTTELVATEFFSQWVIEDNFKTDRFPLEKVGVQFVPDVRPYEEVKLRLLNAAHSLIAYAGINKNYNYVYEAIRDPQIKTEVKGLFAEVIPLLQIPSDLDLDHYTKILLERFDNPLVPHQLRQIAMDGSQKLSQRIFSSLHDAARQKTTCTYLNATLHYWLQYCYAEIPDDPLKEKIELLKNNCSSFEDFQEKFKRQFFVS